MTDHPTTAVTPVFHAPHLRGPHPTVLAAHLREALGELYEAAIDLRSHDPDFELDALLGTRCALDLVGASTRRRVCGVVQRVQWAGPRDARQGRVWLVPALWVLAQRTGRRVFQDRTVPEVVQAVLAAAKLDDALRSELTRPCARHALCVQYAETDLAFITRILASEGIASRFDHEGEREVLVLTDAPATERATVPRAPPGQAPAPREAVHALELTRQVPRGGVAEWSGRGTGNVTSFAPGTVFALAGEEAATGGRSLCVTRVEHHLRVADGAAEGSYGNTFEVVAAEDPVTPRRVVKPVVYGPESAVVAGAPGEAVEVDAQGRIAVRFGWDHSDPTDADAACRVRVARVATASGWTLPFVPRGGMEVLVAFLGGDPDRPLVTGPLYDGAPTAAPAPPAQEEELTVRRDWRVRVTDGFDLRVGTATATIKSDGNYLALNSTKDLSLKTAADRHDETATNHHIKSNRMYLKAGNVVQIVAPYFHVFAGDEIHLQVGGSSINITSGAIDIVSSGVVSIKGSLVKLNC